MTYNGSDELTSINAIKNSGPTTLFDYTYTWAQGANDLDQHQSVSESVAGTTYDHTYDSQNRLTRAQETAGGTNNYQYTYDNDSNILSQDRNGTTTTATYNNADQTCWTYTGTSTNACSSAPTGATIYSYDSTGNGNLTESSAGFSASYNSQNQTTSITPAGGSATAMTYAATGQSSRTGAGTASFVNTELGILATTVSGTATSYTVEPDGMLTSLTSGGATYYYIYDGENNVVGIVNSSATRQATYNYDPFGNATVSGPDAGRLNPYRYQMGYEDSTGLYHFGARYYNPVSRGWTQLDPSGQNPAYIYAGDDPIDETDPSGEQFCPVDAQVTQLPDHKDAPGTTILGQAELQCVSSASGIVFSINLFWKFGSGGWTVQAGQSTTHYDGPGNPASVRGGQWSLANVTWICIGSRKIDYRISYEIYTNQLGWSFDYNDEEPYYSGTFKSKGC